MSKEAGQQAQTTESTESTASMFYGDQAKAESTEVKTEATQEKTEATETDPVKADAEKTEGEKSDAESTEKKDDPGKVELKLPENTALTQKDLEEIAEFAKEKNLTPDQAQMLVERESYAIGQFQAKQHEEFQAKAKAWISDVKADKEIGGEKFSESLMHAKSVIKAHASPEFSKVLDETGLGNHPELIRMLARIGKMSADDKAVTPNTQATVVRDADLFYGSK